MVEVFISYSRKDLEAVSQLAHHIEAEGYQVWWDAELPPHKSYGDVITGKIEDAKAAIVVWSPNASQSEWVRAEADMARNQKKLIQTALGDIIPPLPFNQIQFANIADWNGEDDHIGWRKVKESLLDLCGEREPKPIAGAAGAGVAAIKNSEPTPASSPTPTPAVGTAPEPTPAPIQGLQSPPPASSSSPKWPIFAALGCFGAVVLGAGAFGIGYFMSSDSDDPDTFASLDTSLDSEGSGIASGEEVAPSDTTLGSPEGSTSPPPVVAPAPGSNELSSPVQQGNLGPFIFSGGLTQNQTATHYVNLTGGIEYGFNAACDQDCTDIDLWIYDENGNLISSDTEMDAVPVVGVIPGYDATFRIDILMFECSNEPLSLIHI